MNKINILYRCQLLVFVATSASAAWKPGLWGGFHTAGSTAYTTPSIYTNVYLDTHAATNYTGSTVASTEPVPIWSNNRCWQYWGQIYLPAGDVTFGARIDDTAQLTIDGTVVLAQSGNIVTKNFAVADWHDFKFCCGNGGGAAGPWSGTGLVARVVDGVTINMGFGIKEGDATEWSYPAEDGSMSRYRYDNGLGFNNDVYIFGAPGNYGIVTPGYGVVQGLSDGQTFQCSAPESVDLGGGVFAYNQGYTILTNGVVKTDAPGVRSFTYTHSTEAVENYIRWNWLRTFQYTFAASAGGTVSTNGGFYAEESTVSVTAIPGNGYGFSHWVGDIWYGLNTDNPVISATAIKTSRLVAVFTNGVPHPRYSGGRGDGFGMGEATASLGVTAVVFTSPARQIIERTSLSVPAGPFEISAADVASGHLKITIPDKLPLTWDTTVVSPAVAGPVSSAVTYENADKTAVFPISGSLASPATISGLCYTNAANFVFPERLSLDIDGDGSIDAFSSGILGVTVFRPGGLGSPAASATSPEDLPIHIPPQTLFLLR